MDFISEALLSSGPFSIAVSLIFNILISVLGFIPSVFITAANITVFGFEKGLILSYMGKLPVQWSAFGYIERAFKHSNPSS